MQSYSEPVQQFGFCAVPPGQQQQPIFQARVTIPRCPFCPSEEVICSKLCSAFGCSATEETLLSFQKFDAVVKACGLSHFWRRPLFDLSLENPQESGRRRVPDEGSPFSQVQVRSSTFISRWLSLKRKHEAGREVHRCLDSSSLFVDVVGRGIKNRLSADDLVAWVEDVADRALDLTDSYLREPYVDTVLARILLRYGVHLTGILTASSLRQNGFARLMDGLSRCTGLIPRVSRSIDPSLVFVCPDELLDLPDEFSYDDFLAVFGLYWELTAKQRSLECIRPKDLWDYTPLSKRFISEVFKVASVRPFSSSLNEISYPDFVWLIVSAECKGSWPQSAEYLFRVLDVQSDGVLTPDELHFFYEEHIRQWSKNTVPFEDMMCELLDAIRPTDPSRFTLLDICRSGMAHIFFAPFVDSPDNHHHRRWSVHRRRTSHASWWPNGSLTNPGYWDCFVQERLEHIRNSEHLRTDQQNESTQNTRNRFSKRNFRSRHRKSRNKN